MADDKQAKIDAIVAAFNRGLKTSLSRAKHLNQFIEYQKQLQLNPDAPNPLPLECFGPTVLDVAKKLVDEGIEEVVKGEMSAQLADYEGELVKIEAKKQQLKKKLEDVQPIELQNKLE